MDADSNMTKHVSPEIAGTELIGTDYKLFLDMAVHAIGYKHFTIARALALMLTSRLDTKVPAGLGDTAEEASRNRAKIERYNARRPEKAYPEHTMYPRDSRNASPTRKKDAAELNAFWDYRALNESAEPLQSNYLQADNDNFGYDPESVEGDAKQPLRSAEAEWEMRPSPEEMAARYSVPTVKYETRMVHTSDYPRLIEPGYCLTCGKTEMKIPVSGDVECVGFHKGRLREYEHAARMSLAGLTIRKTQKQINIYVDRILKPERLNISDVAMSRKWTLFRIGDLYFAPYRTKTFSRGEVVKYGSDGGMFPAKDEYGTPYGPKSKGSVADAWKPLHPRTSKSSVEMLSPAALAKQWANKNKPLPCPLPTDDELEVLRLMLQANGKPANDNKHYDGLPHDVESADELQFGYAFGTKYPEMSDPEPFDDVVLRKDFLAVLNARLSPEALRVANMTVQTDLTESLAQNRADVGAALADRKNASERTLMRNGDKALASGAKEIGAVLQDLAA
jgi:hypothetical protein